MLYGSSPLPIDERRQAQNRRHLARDASFFFFFNVYLFLRQRQSMSGGGAEREGDRI